MISRLKTNASSILNLFSNIFVKFSTFVISIILTRNLTQNDFGAITIALTFATLIFPLCTLSIPDAFMIISCQHKKKLSEIYNLFFSALFIGFLGIFFIFTVMMILNVIKIKSFNLSWIQPLVLFLMYLFPFLFFTLFINLLRVYGRNDLFALFGGIVSFILLVLVFLATYLNLKLQTPLAWIFCYSFFSLYLIGCISTRRFKKSILRFFNSKNYINKKLFSLGFSISLGVVASTATLSIDLLMVGYLLGEKFAGIYKVATILPITLTIIPASKLAVDFKMLVKHTDEHQVILKYYKNFIKQYLIISLILVVLVSIFSSSAIYLFFGSQYNESASLMVLLSLLIPIFFCLRLPLGSIFNAIGLVKINVKIAYIVLGLIILLCYILIPYYGVRGAAISVIFSHLFGGGISLYVFRAHLVQ